MTPRIRSPLAALVAEPVICIAGALAILSSWFPMRALIGLEMATGHWISATLVATGVVGGLAALAALVVGRQSPADLGLRGRDLLPAVGATVGLWLAMQGAAVMAAAISGTSVTWQPGWSTQALGGAMLGPLLAQLVANALMEEINFRGFLWPQLALRLKTRVGDRAAWAVAAVASQAIFALMHVPIRLYGGADAATLAAMLVNLFAIGLVFCVVYAATRNLFVVVGYHALLNTPTLLVSSSGPAPQTVATVAVLALAAACVWRRRIAGRRLQAGDAPVAFAVQDG